jgi:hypothetical protein
MYRTVDFDGNTVELHLSGLMGSESHPDRHKLRIIGFFL